MLRKWEASISPTLRGNSLSTHELHARGKERHLVYVPQEDWYNNFRMQVQKWRSFWLLKPVPFARPQHFNKSQRLRMHLRNVRL